MPPESLSEREFELINIVGAQLATNQRDLSRTMDLSLGAINMLLRRLVAKGYIRVEQLNNRKVKYLLTPQGFSEKLRKSVNYTVKTIQSISLIKQRLRTIVRQLVGAGQRHFFIFGRSDFSLLVEHVLKEELADQADIKFIDAVPSEALTGVVLICTDQHLPLSWKSGQEIFNVIEALAQDEEFLTFSKN